MFCCIPKKKKEKYKLLKNSKKSNIINKNITNKNKLNDLNENLSIYDDKYIDLQRFQNI